MNLKNFICESHLEKKNQKKSLIIFLLLFYNLKFDKKGRLTVPNLLKCRIGTASHPMTLGTVDRSNLGSCQYFEMY